MTSKQFNYSIIITRTLFFIFFYLYNLFVINPAIIDFIQQPAFFINNSFLHEHLNYPGGLIEYISLFLSQFYHFPWFGALILTSVVWSITFITGKVLRSLEFNKYLLLLQLIPAIGLLFIHSKHDYILTTTMLLLSSVLFFYLYLQFSKQKLIVKSTGLILSSVFLFYISGGSALLNYLFMCLIFELFSLNKYYSAINFILIFIACIIPYLSARFLFYVTLKQAYFNLLVSEPYYHPPLLLYMLFLFYPLLVIISKLSKLKFFNNILIFNRKKASDKKPVLNASFIIQLAIIILLTAITLNFAVEPEQTFINKVKYLAYNEDWDKLLRLVKEHPSDDRFVNFHMNRALYHTGKLADAMFEYPQNWGKHALFLGEIVTRTVLMDNSDVYFDLGHIRAAQHWAYEAQTIYENSPRVLKRLVLTNIILGNYKAANSILGILKNSIIYKGWAEYYQQLIDNPAKLEKETFIKNKRNMQPTAVFFMDRTNVNYDLLFLLGKNRNNKMAFEYLMAYYLLSNEIGNAVKNLKYLKVLGYEEIPVIYQEALMVYLSKMNIKRINLEGYTISKNITGRYRDYARIVFKYKNNMQAAQEELFNIHGNTYWYYLHYNSPVTNKRELEFFIKK